MKKLIHEAHRRSLWQVLGIYLAGSWIALQVVAQLADSVGFPDWVEPFALVLLIIGLPIVMATAFVQEGVAPTKAGAGGSGAGLRPGRGQWTRVPGDHVAGVCPLDATGCRAPTRG